MRYIIIILVFLITAVLFLQSRVKVQHIEKPIFLQVDEVANHHSTIINTQIHTFYKPSKEQLFFLEKDYSAIWAHLNYLYQTNDVQKGKEYYTEDWFKMINLQYKKPLNTPIKRVDLQHNLHVLNWSFDGLVCNAIDSNVVLKTFINDKCIDSTIVTFAIALLFQGDHWRLEGVKYVH